jgi:hypothetical protein
MKSYGADEPVTGCQEDTARLSRNVAHLGHPCPAVRACASIAGLVGVEWWCQAAWRCAPRCELQAARSFAVVGAGHRPVAALRRLYRSNALLYFSAVRRSISSPMHHHPQPANQELDRTRFSLVCGSPQDKWTSQPGESAYITPYAPAVETHLCKSTQLPLNYLWRTWIRDVTCHHGLATTRPQS